MIHKYKKYIFDSPSIFIYFIYHSCVRDYRSFVIFYCYTRECFSVTTVAYYPWVNNTLIREGSEFMGRWGGGF